MGLWASGKYDEAEHAWTTALSLDNWSPNKGIGRDAGMAKCYFNLGMVKLNKGECIAHQFWKKAIQLYPPMRQKVFEKGNEIAQDHPEFVRDCFPGAFNEDT